MAYKDPEKRREAARNYYHKRMQDPEYRAHLAATRREYRERVRERVRQAKDVPCADCGVKYPYYVMDLDHLPGTEKKFTLAMSTRKSTRGAQGMVEVEAELKKCEAVCSNCHRERTHGRKYGTDSD